MLNKRIKGLYILVLSSSMCYLSHSTISAIEPISTKIFLSFDLFKLPFDKDSSSSPNASASTSKAEIWDEIKKRNLGIGIQFGGTRLYGGFTIVKQPVDVWINKAKSFMNANSKEAEEETTKKEPTVVDAVMVGEEEVEIESDSVISDLGVLKDMDFFLGIRLTENFSFLFHLKNDALLPGLGLSFFNQSLNLEVTAPNLLSQKLADYRLNSVNFQLRIAFIPFF